MNTWNLADTLSLLYFKILVYFVDTILVFLCSFGIFLFGFGFGNQLVVVFVGLKRL